MSRSSARAACVLLAVWGGIAAGSLAGSPKPDRLPAPLAFEPDLEAIDPPGSMTLSGSTWVHEGPGHRVRLQLLSDDQRLAYIEHVTGARVDPFASPPDAARRFVSFVLEVANLGTDGLPFNPESCWLFGTKKDGPQLPYSLDALAFDYRATDLEPPTAYRSVGPALLDRPQIIAPGGSLAGLLNYRMAHLGRAKRLRLDIELVLPGGDRIHVSAPYKLRKAAKRGDAP